MQLRLDFSAISTAALLAPHHSLLRASSPDPRGVATSTERPSCSADLDTPISIPRRTAPAPPPVVADQAAASHDAPRSRRPPEVYSTAEIQPILAACPPTVFGHRHRALIVVMWRAGLRISEALALRIVDLDRAAGRLRVVRGKGGRSRVVAADDTFAVVEDWLASRRAHNVPEHAPLFCAFDGAPVFAASDGRTLAILRRHAGLRKRVHAHAFRHTHAADLWCAGVPERLIQVQLGHGQPRHHRQVPHHHRYSRTARRRRSPAPPWRSPPTESST